MGNPGGQFLQRQVNEPVCHAVTADTRVKASRDVAHASPLEGDQDQASG